MQLGHLTPHGLRRTCAKLCHVNGGEIDQIQFLLGHAPMLTSERYLGYKRNLEKPVNDDVRAPSSRRAWARSRAANDLEEFILANGNVLD